MFTDYFCQWFAGWLSRMSEEGDISKSDMGSIQISGDSSQPQITTVKFDGNNYPTW